MFDWILEAFRLLIYFISIWIYKLITWLYNIFMRLCNSRILDSEILELMASRIGVILGIIMLFIVIFSMLQMVLEPDKMSDKEKGFGNIIKKVLIVIVMLGMSSSAFSLMYGVQKTIIKSNIIAKFILPYEVDTERFGGLLSAELFTAFYNFDKNLAADGYQGDEKMCEDSIATLKGEIIENNEFAEGWTCINKESGDAYIIDFNIILLPIVGIGAVYFIFSYCLSIGMRTFQLVFLEVISPMAIVSYLSPKKETMFNKWWKIYFSTYVDVFLRVALINIVVFLIGVIFDANLSGTFWESVGGKDGTMTDTLITVFIIMSLLMFAKKAPDLIKELFPGPPSKLGFGVTPPKKLLDSMAGADLIKRGYGAVNVGANTLQNTFRKNFGKFLEDKKEGEWSEKDTKNLLRATFGSVWSGVGGMRRGLMTTNAAQRKSAAENAYNRTQAQQKLHDAGYGFGGFNRKGFAGAKVQWDDAIRGFWKQDQMISDMTSASDSAINALQQALNEASQKYTGTYHIQASLSKPGDFLVTDSEGKVLKDGNGIPKIFSRDEAINEVNRLDGGHGDAAMAMAEIEQQIGKSKSTNKALHQKENEAKSKEKK